MWIEKTYEVIVDYLIIMGTISMTLAAAAALGWVIIRLIDTIYYKYVSRGDTYTKRDRRYKDY